MFIDESGFDEHLIPEYGRAPRGEKIRAEKKGKKPARLNLIAGLWQKTLLAPALSACHTTAAGVNSWLERSLLPALPPHAVIIMDHAPFHKTTATRELIEKCGHHVLYLPPYSPDLNPIEPYWAIIKSKVRKLFTTDQSLDGCIKMALQTI